MSKTRDPIILYPHPDHIDPDDWDDRDMDHPTWETQSAATALPLTRSPDWEEDAPMAKVCGPGYLELAGELTTPISVRFVEAKHCDMRNLGDYVRHLGETHRETGETPQLLRVYEDNSMRFWDRRRGIMVGDVSPDLFYEWLPLAGKFYGVMVKPVEVDKMKDLRLIDGEVLVKALKGLRRDAVEAQEMTNEAVAKAEDAGNQLEEVITDIKGLLAQLGADKE
jgi:hypothetical protein